MEKQFMSLKKNVRKKENLTHGEIEPDTVHSIEKDKMIRYICKDCGYEENVPLWIVEEMYDMKDLLENPDEYASMMCPECNGTMIIKKQNNNL